MLQTRLHIKWDFCRFRQTDKIFSTNSVQGRNNSSAAQAIQLAKYKYKLYRVYMRLWIALRHADARGHISERGPESSVFSR